MMEILAPAGSIDSVIAAVRAGADAVYFGTDSFNARKNAKGFTNDDFISAVEYCKIRGVRVYLTLNTLVRDEEMKDAVNTAIFAANSGISGIIIQDFGLAMLLKKIMPSVPLHASTQMSVYNLSGVKYLHTLGYKRIVLSREVSRENMKKIAEYSNKHGIELEIFTQGALCMSVSGMCLFSALLGGRSGNRGLCAGTCRLPFSVENGTGYDLSLKDLNLYKYFNEFSLMNISSLKIEGRMKRPEYVAMAVDCAVAARDNPQILPQKLDNLQKIFSRSGFCDGYYTGKADKEMFGVRSEQDIDNSKEILNSAHEIYRHERATVRVDMKISVKSGEKSALTVSDGENTVTLFGAIPQTAKTAPCNEEYLFKKLSKCGGTPYYTGDFSAEIDDNLILLSSELNSLRHTALDMLSEKRKEFTAPKIDSAVVEQLLDDLPKPKVHSPEFTVSFHSAKQLPKGLENFQLVIMPMNTENDVIKNLIQGGVRLAVKTPMWFDDDEKIERRLNELSLLGVKYAVAQNYGALPLIKSTKMNSIAGEKLNVFNSYSAKYLDVSDIMLSYELSLQQVAKMRINKPYSVCVYGKLPLMVLKNCPRKAYNTCDGCDGKITDRKNITFKLMCEDGVTGLYADRPMWLADRLREVHCTGACLEFTDESTSEVQNIINLYKNGEKPPSIFNRGLSTNGVL